MALMLDFLVPESDVAESSAAPPAVSALPPQLVLLDSALRSAPVAPCQIGPPEPVEPRLTPELWTDFLRVL